MERMRSNRTALSKSKTFTSPVMICIAMSVHSSGYKRGGTSMLVIFFALATLSMWIFCVAEFDKPTMRDAGYF